MDKQIKCPMCESENVITIMTDKESGKSFCPRGHGIISHDQVDEHRKELGLDNS